MHDRDIKKIERSKVKEMTYKIKQAEGNYDILVQNHESEPVFTLRGENGSLMSLNWKEDAKVQIEGYVTRKVANQEQIPYDVANALISEGYVNEKGMMAIQPLINYGMDSHGKIRQSQPDYMVEFVDDAVDSWEEVTPVPALTGLEAKFGEESNNA